jgi:diaminohydroxyphosphoribosylaminopyrimidine deaminase/5-amino-6-(5-phosphoribosylamino)uracil reductase
MPAVEVRLRAVIMPGMPDRDRHFLRMAARLALRGHGGAEPNPLVGAVVVSREGVTVGRGYHRQFGGPHAEVIALRQAGTQAAGATLYCTLEPCDHAGKTPPCTQAIIAANVSKVVIGRRDPNPIAAGGLNRLRTAGIAVEVIDDCEQAIAVSDPFAHCVRSGLPWVTVKWAQTLDGKIATRAGDSKWISNAASRRMVHRERGRVDAILTGIGTVLADDPLLTARDVRVRRVARRVVIDPQLKIPLKSRLVQTAKDVPLIVVCDAAHARRETADALREHGADVTGFAMDIDGIPLAPALRDLVSRFDVTNVLVESGSGLMRRLFRQKLVKEAWVFVAPMILGDEEARPAFDGFAISRIADAFKLRRVASQIRGGDIVTRYLVAR